MKLPPEILATYVLSTPTFVRRYLNDFARSEFTEQQLEIFETLDARTEKGIPVHRKVLLVMPRGYRKSSTI